MKFIDCIPALKQGLSIQKNNGDTVLDRVKMNMRSKEFYYRDVEKMRYSSEYCLDLEDLEREDWEIIS